MILVIVANAIIIDNRDTQMKEMNHILILVTSNVDIIIVDMENGVEFGYVSSFV